MNTRELDVKLFQFTTLPVLAVCLLVALSFASLHFARNWQVATEQSDFVKILFSSSQTNFDEYKKHFDQSSLALLQTKGFISTALFDKNTKLIKFHGLPIRKHAITGKLHTIEPWAHDQLGYTSIRLSSNEGWVVIVQDQQYVKLATYHDIFFLITVSFIALCISAFMGYKLRNYLLKPIRNIQNGLKRLQNASYDSPIRTEQQGIYKTLIREINKLAAQQKLFANESQQNIEQATSELRETLETVEIQNIEIDLARKNAVQANRQKSEFLANTSHEIRTPLNGIIGFTDLLKSTDLNAQQSEYLSTIEESAKSLLVGINDIIDFSRLEIGKLNLDFKPVVIRQTVEEALQMSAPIADEKNLRLISIVDKKIPQQLLGDPLRIKQVLTNLISNAVKYAPEGNIQINVSMEHREDNQVTLKFKVTDVHTTITPQRKEEINNLLANADLSEVQALDKSDMGLVIAKGLTDRMNGSIGLIFKENTSSTFWFTAILGRTTLETIPQITDHALENVSAIIYDNDPVGQMELEHLISGWHAKVAAARNFNDVISIARQAQTGPNKPVVILDTQISKHGFNKNDLEELVQELATPPAIPIIAIVPPKLQHIITPLLPPHICLNIQRPIISKLMFDLICKQIGVMQSNIIETEKFDGRTPSNIEPQQANILAVDDNPSNLKLLAEFLRDMNCRVTAVESGFEAIEKIENNQYSLVLMDIQMPDMDGYQTTKKIREIEKSGQRTPIIALTAHAVEEEKSKLLLAGMDDFLSKPVSDKELAEMLQRWAPNHSKITVNTGMRRAITSTAQAIEKQPNQLEDFDLSHALALTKNKADLAKDMLVMLLKECQDNQDTIEQLFTSKKYDSLQEIIHKIHGGCCYSGVPKLKKASENLDKNLKNNLLSNIEFDYKNFKTAVTDILSWQDSLDIDALFEE